ncbi:enkurin-like [Sycon ciliatum]|uniref:enkurin-like n=1 Tax=Sycon ciliatum TaxID=27933 RepID=UPI0020AE85B7|eukprot:scpid74564/ scgid30386/ Enkurin
MAYYGRRAVVKEESIYNLVPRPAQKREKQPRYTSTFRPQVKEEIKSKQVPSKTMGPAKVGMPSTQSYLKKHSKEHRVEELGTTRKTAESESLLRSFGATSTKTSTKPAVPRHTERPAMGVKTHKDFITHNAVKAISSVPTRPQPKLVDAPTGTTKVLEDQRTDAGLLPKYVNKQGYGEVPKYLQTRKAVMDEAQDNYDAYVARRQKANELATIQDKDRDNVLEGLKKHWQELQHQFLGLSVVTDTLPKKARKERIEAEMKQLENDIQTIESHKAIYIAPVA